MDQDENPKIDDEKCQVDAILCNDHSHRSQDEVSKLDIGKAMKQ